MITIPVTATGTWNVVFTDSAIEFACVRLPMPKDATTANNANSQPRTAPSFLCLKAFFIVYIGPPDISPFSLTSLYLIASIHSLNLEVSPKQALIHIQTSAPGPPDTIAVATPTILPVPIVAASAVVNAENGEISPFPLVFCLASLLRVLLIAYPRFRQVRNPVRIVRNTPVPTNRISITGPHTKSSTVTSTSASFSINPFILHPPCCICFILCLYYS